MVRYPLVKMDILFGQSIKHIHRKMSFSPPNFDYIHRTILRRQIHDSLTQHPPQHVADMGLDTPARLSIVDPAWGRRIHLDSTGSRSAVLWNPWVDKARRLSQFPDEAWQNMLCIETANLLEDVVQLESDERHRLQLRLSSEATAP